MTLLEASLLEYVEELRMVRARNVANVMELVSMVNAAPVIWTTTVTLTIGPNVLSDSLKNIMFLETGHNVCQLLAETLPVRIRYIVFSVLLDLFYHILQYFYLRYTIYTII